MKIKDLGDLKLGFFQEHGNFFKLGLCTHFNSFLEMIFIFEFQMVWEMFSIKNFKISKHFSVTRFFDHFTLFSKFHDFGVRFILNLWIHSWIACGDLEARGKGKSSSVGWFLHIWGKWISKPCWVYWNLISPLLV